ncbi:phosphate signaling complex protein PhoU [Desulfobotulus sp. H1]|uniref:Phosphate-specific transport system accessory protein PhoU n=1 Tax=Desulfobotulus pelophilus TaxID=2823377 RepID=A0ABT3N4T0_9BACT|nr:phosphate signaling complex protein PhoU [Desulfobotulus pelophilus]MCW7752468.1 phosphate signaling complex protein PhoU [Desulfobotulus pelophilus]
MSLFLHNELESLKKNLLSLGTMVEDRVHRVSTSIVSMDHEVARQVVSTDHEIDEREVEIEEECLKIIALYQPVAVDLRFLVCVIKINNDLERIADLAVNIGRRVMTMASATRHVPFYDYTAMAAKVGSMLQKSLDAFVTMDAGLANAVRAMDDEVDVMNKDVYDRVKKRMGGDPENVGYLINMFLISRHLERIADHATNIAEEVIYVIEGQIVRHSQARV